MGIGTLTTLLISLLITNALTDQNVINIAGLYPFPSTNFSGATPYAVQLALDHINSNSTILQNYHLNITFGDSGCEEKIAVRSLFEFIHTPKYTVVFGAWCSKATDVVAELALAYDIPVVSWASTSPSFTNSKLYPQLLLGTPSDINTVAGQLILIQQLNVRRVVIINEQEDLFITISHRLQLFLDEVGVSYLTEIYNEESNNYLQTIDLVLSRIQTEGYSVVVLNGRERAYVNIMCRLKKFPSLYAPRTTWIILGWYTSWSHDVEGYTDGECNLEDLVAVSSGSLAVNPTVGFEEFDLEKSPTISGFAPKELYDKYELLVTKKEGGEFFEKQRNFYDAYAYDCIWTIAMGLDKLSADYNLTTGGYNGTVLFDAIQQVRFNGWAGDVIYLERVRQESRIHIYEVINATFEARGLYVNVPFNHSNLIGNENITYMERTPFTIFNPDKVTDGIEEHYIHTAIFVLTVIFSLLGVTYITILIVVISVGWIKQYAAVTKSEPSVNIVIISGNYVIFVLALLWSIDGRYIQVYNNQPVCTFVCHLRIWLFAVSTSIIFGGMLGKAIKYYIIAIKHKFSYAEYLKFYQILLIPLVLVLIDTVYVLIWALGSPITYNFINIDSNLQNPPIYRVAECQPENRTNFLILFITFILYKSILVIIGLFLAYHLRKVINKANKYSSTITWTMYNVVIFSILQIVLILTLTDVDIKYGLVCLSTILEGFAISSIVAGPIIYYLYKDPNGKRFRPTPTREEFPEDTSQLKEKIRTLENQNSQLREKVTIEMSGNCKETSQTSFENPLSSN
eukprot:TRINITY_DN2767_c0_g1_i1.p1 TRINITY_DN2767_c0_g1~~TRINITY_DN2767_c0_g1_i1.p1  ORF type:complete len:796 (-),score=129.49 TRINITY_DN2767_c0_g1_i1:88-2475(-)